MSVLSCHSPGNPEVPGALLHPTSLPASHPDLRGCTWVSRTDQGFKQNRARRPGGQAFQHIFAKPQSDGGSFGPSWNKKDLVWLSRARQPRQLLLQLLLQPNSAQPATVRVSLGLMDPNQSWGLQFVTISQVTTAVTAPPQAAAH